MVELKNLKIKNLALVRRGANKVNHSVLKGQKIDDFFKEETKLYVCKECGHEMENPKDLKCPECGAKMVEKSEVVLKQLKDIYYSENPKAELMNLLKSNGVQLEDTREITADDYMREERA